jgi:hypothetical protein
MTIATIPERIVKRLGASAPFSNHFNPNGIGALMQQGGYVAFDMTQSNKVVAEGILIVE